MRVRLAKAIQQQFLILDEPTNDLDREGRDSLLNFLRQYKFGILMISHDRECLNLCEDVLELSNQGLTKYGGGWKSYEESKQSERHHSEKSLEHAKKEREEAQEKRQELLARQEKRNRKGKESAKKGGLPRILLGLRKQNAQSTSGKIQSESFDKSQEKVSAAYKAFQQMKIDPIMYTDLIGTSMGLISFFLNGSIKKISPFYGEVISESLLKEEMDLENLLLLKNLSVNNLKQGAN